MRRSGIEAVRWKTRIPLLFRQEASANHLFHDMENDL